MKFPQTSVLAVCLPALKGSLERLVARSLPDDTDYDLVEIQMWDLRSWWDVGKAKISCNFKMLWREMMWLWVLNRSLVCCEDKHGVCIGRSSDHLLSADLRVCHLYPSPVALRHPPPWDVHRGLLLFPGDTQTCFSNLTKTCKCDQNLLVEGHWWPHQSCQS